MYNPVLMYQVDLDETDFKIPDNPPVLDYFRVPVGGLTVYTKP